MSLQTEDGEGSQINVKMYQFLNNFCKATNIALSFLTIKEDLIVPQFTVSQIKINTVHGNKLTNGIK